MPPLPDEPAAEPLRGKPPVSVAVPSGALSYVRLQGNRQKGHRFRVRFQPTVVSALVLHLLLVLFTAPVAQAQDSAAGSFFKVESLHEGLEPAGGPVLLDTPQSMMETFIFAAEGEDWNTAAYALDLSEIPQDLQAKMGPVEEIRQLVNSALPGIDLYELYDDDGVMHAQRVSFAGLEMVSYLTDASVAELEFEPPEMAQQSTVRPDRAIERPTRVQRAVFDLTFGESAPEGLLPPTTLHQSAQRLANGKVRLTVDMDSENALAEDDTPGTDASYMGASIMIDHTDEEVRKLAAQVRRRAGEDADDYDFGRSARRFVTRYITGMNLATGDATASEVARNRSGDCTECAVLLAAILRAEGIPSRCVTGLAYAADEFAGVSDVFVYHMWTQAWIADGEGDGGKWIDLDSAMYRYTATHITLGTSAMDDASAGAEMIKMIPMMNGLEIEVVEVER